MDTINGYEIISEWKNSTCGKITCGMRGGKKYFIKRYQTPVEPYDNGSLDARTIEVNREKFNKYVSLRTRVNNALRSIAGSGGNIVPPVDEFIYDHHYHEVSEFIEGVVPEKEIESTIAALNDEEKKLVLLTAANALDSIHKCGMIHSDLKIKNILLAKSRDNKLVTKLVDFDNAYFQGELPDEVVGDINYYSPELGAFSSLDDEDKESSSIVLTTKSDIFSLGLIFHRYLSGEFPAAVSLTEKLQRRKDRGKALYCWTIINEGCELKVSSKIKKPVHAKLIEEMLKRDPEERPSANEVWRTLKGLRDVSSGASGSTAPARPSGRPSSSTSTSRPSPAPRPTPAPRPVLPTEVYLDEPWPEDAIVFDKDKIKASGYASVKRATQSGANGYRFALSDGRSLFMNKKSVLSRKYATEGSGAGVSAGSSATPSASPSAGTTAGGFCEAWPEHRMVFDETAIRARGYVRSEQCEVSGIKGYYFYRANGRQDFIKDNLALMFKMARRI